MKTMDNTNSLEIINNNAALHGMSTPMIPCCLCGAMIFANNCNQCSTCLAQQFDLRVSDKNIVFQRLLTLVLLHVGYSPKRRINNTSMSTMP